VEAPNAGASTPLAFRFAVLPVISSTAGDTEGDVRSALPWGDTRVVASTGRGNNNAPVCRNGDGILAQIPGG
jgi:hypothetical protein